MLSEEGDLSIPRSGARPPPSVTSEAPSQALPARAARLVSEGGSPGGPLPS